MKNKKTCTRQKLCFKRLLSLLLSLILLLQSFPIGAMAAEEYSGRTENSFLSSESVQEEMEETTGGAVSEKIEMINEGKQIPLMDGSPSDPDQYAVHLDNREKEEIQLVRENESVRSEFSKEFMKANGQPLVAVYPQAVHFQSEGEWKEIDNTLLLGSKGYQNASGPWEITLPETMSHESGVEIRYNDVRISYVLEGVREAEGLVLEKEAEEKEKIDTLAQQTIPQGFSSSILYEGVKEGVSVRMDLVSNFMEESVIFASREAVKETQVSYRFSTDGLKMKTNEKNQVILYDQSGEKELLILEAPYISDAKGKVNFEIQTVLEELRKPETEAESERVSYDYRLTYLLPRKWLKEETRAYPVTLDPVIKPELSASNIQDQTIYQRSSYYTSPSWGMVEFGRDNSYGIARFVMKYNDLPTLSSSDVLTHAELRLYKLQQSDSLGELHVHALEGEWSEDSVNWSNCPVYKTAVEDYQFIYPSGWYGFIITDIARGWYENGNTGMLFKASDEIEQGNVSNWKQFCSSEYSSNYLPVLYLSYLNNSGIESNWEYEVIDAGRAGTGYVNDFTGNLTLIHPDMSFSGNRMPVSLNHIYNASDASENRFGLGYGWRTSYNQLVYSREESEDPEYYVWEDGDGTRQYFRKDEENPGEYKEERGSGLILTKSGSGDETYCIRDDQGNKLFFDAGGRLKESRNNQETTSSIRVTYVSNTSTSSTYRYIRSVIDGAGRVYLFAYSSGRLSSIKFRGTGETDLYRLSFQFDGENNLTSIVYPDRKQVTYTYETGHLLTCAQDINGYRVEYRYSQNGSYLPTRVTSIETFDEEEVGGSLTISYAHNETTLTDHNGNKEILQFSDWGNVISVQDGQGRAEFSRYAEEDLDGDTGKVNQLIRQSKLQNTIANLIINSGFEYSGWWTAYSGNSSSGSINYATAYHYFGDHSFRILRSENGGTYKYGQTQSVQLEAGKTYTLSGWMKTVSMSGDGNGANLQIYSGNTLLAETERVTTTKDWQRYEVTFTVENDTNVKVYMSNETAGYAYFDALQLEESTSAGRYNLVENGDFRLTSTSYNSGVFAWSETSTALSGGMPVTATESAAPQLDTQAYQINGRANTWIQTYQLIPVSGVRGDVITFSGWAKADSVPVERDESRLFCLILKFNYDDGSTENFILDFNPDADSSQNWQYGATRAIALKAYHSVYLYMAYDYNLNTALFDGIQLYKEMFCHSYVYDENGKIVSAQDLQKQTTTYEYQNNDLVSAITRDGSTIKAKMEYTYDNYHNVLTATTLEGVTQTFEYDTYGNNTTVRMGGSGEEKKITYSATYSSDGNHLQSMTDAIGNVTTYGIDPETSLTQWVRYSGDSEQEKTEYTYDGVFHLTTIRRMKGTETIETSYEYDQDRIERLESPSGTRYNLEYGAFGQMDQIRVGSSTLAEYTYSEDVNRYLLRMDYGNSDYRTYGYDSYGRMIRTGYEDETISGEYEYNSDGYLGRVTDHLSGRVTKYLYDLSGRSAGYEASGENFSQKVSYGYDDLSNVTSITEKLNGLTYISSFSYDLDNRIIGSENRREGSQIAGETYRYDGLNRLIGIGLQRNTSSLIQTQISYVNPDNISTTTLVEDWNHTLPGGSENYHYTYDEKNNILSITDNAGTVTYEYDSLSQLIRENNPAAGKTWTYEYDNGGNILQKKEYAYTTGVPGRVLKTVTYNYTDDNWPDLLTGIQDENASRSITSDEIGNPLSDGEWTYEWKHGRQLAGMSQTGTQIRYEYDLDGLRTEKTVNGVTTRYTYLDGKLTEMTKGSDVYHFYYDALGPSSFTLNTTRYYYLRNMQGDIVGILNASGSRAVSYRYDAWGKLLSISGSLAGTIGQQNPLRYRGYIYDNETGFYYVINRYYNPEINRWIHGDSLISTGRGLYGLNGFQYCYNNPVNTLDSNGKDAIWIQEEENVGGFGHSGLMIQDEFGVWYLFYWGPYPTLSFLSAIFPYPHDGYLMQINVQGSDLFTTDGVKQAIQNTADSSNDSAGKKLEE